MAEDDRNDESGINISCWDDVVFQYNEDTITKTFGLCSYDCMFEAQTVAIINSNSSVKRNPTVKAAKNREEICLAIDRNFYIFSDNYCELKFSLRAESVIESFAEAGDFILIGESNGELKLIFTPLSQTVLSKTLFTSGFKEVILTRKDDELYEAIICSCDNVVYRIFNINLDAISEALKLTDTARIRQLCGQIEILDVSNEFSDGFVIEHYNTFTDVNQNSSLMLAGSGSAVLKIKSDCEQQVLENDIFNNACLLKSEISSDGRYIVVLDSENILHFLCARSLLVLKSWFHVKISDFMFWESPSLGSDFDSDTKLLVLTLPSDNFSFLQMYNFSNFEIVYTTQLSEFSSFVHMSAQQENLFILEGIVNPEISNEENYITSIKIKCIQEMQPEAKLSRLLKKRKFKDAEEFANLFKLDKEVIYWTQLNCIFEAMIHGNCSNLSKESIDELESSLFSCISRINNTKQLIASCRNLAMPTLGLFKKFLEKLKSSADVNDISQLNNISYRLQTFQLIFGEENFSSQWQLFSSCNMLNEFTKHFQEYREDIALNLWLRHDHEIIKVANIEDLLNVISLNLNIKHFFSYILPSILKLKPESLIVVTDWIIGHCKNMELYEKEEWPSKALHFTTKSMEIIESFNLTFKYVNLNLNEIQTRISLLSNFKNELEDLKELWNNYNCYISYSNLIQEDKTNVACQMLDDVLENSYVSTFIFKYLSSFTKRFDLNINSILLEYLERVLSSMCASSWEHVYIIDRILIIFNSINSDDYICKAALAVTSYAEIPWNEVVTELVEKCLSINHILVSKIKEQIQYANIKKILIPYGLKNCNIGNQKLMKQITQYIASQNTATSLADALEISKLSDCMTDESDVYLFKLQQLLTNGSMDDFMAVLKYLPQECLAICCNRFVNFVTALINANADFSLSDNEMEEIRSLKAALTLIRFTAVRCESASPDDLLGKFENMIVLKVEFGINMSFDQLESTLHCRNIFQNQMVNETCSSITRAKFNKLLRLGNVLKIDREVVVELLLRYAINAKNGTMAIEVLEYFKLDFCREKGNIFSQSIYDFIKCAMKNLLPSDVSKILMIFEELTSTKLIHYNQIEHMNIYLSIRKWILFLSQLYSNETTVSNSSWMNGESYQELVFLFADSDDLLTNSVLSLIETLLQMNKEEITTDLLVTEGRRVCDLLKSKGALSQAFELTLELNGLLSSRELMEMNPFDVEDLNATLFKTILHRKPLDKRFAFGLGVCLPVESVKRLLNNSLKSFNHDCGHTQAVADLATQIFKFLKLPDEQLQYNSLHKRVLWRKKISDLKIDSDCFDAARIEEEINWKNCIREFASNRLLTLDFIVEFCTTFSGCLDEALIYYVECILMQTDFKINPITTFKDKNSDSICSANSSHDSYTEDMFLGEYSDLRRIVDNVITLIEDKSLLLQRLKSVFKKICPYNYEKILIVLCQIKNLIISEESEDTTLIQRKIDLLKFLFVYRRVSLPSEAERTIIKEFGCERLPFHAFVNENPWNILTPELDLETINIWTCAIPLLQLSSTDDILVIAIQNDIKRSLEKLEKNSNLSKTFPHSKLEKIFEILKQVTNPTLALSCGNWVTTALPLGPEKVYSAKCTVDLAKHMTDEKCKMMELVPVSNQPVNSFEENCKKLLRVFQQVSAEVVLMNYNLRNDETKQLLRTPRKLLIHLYKEQNGRSAVKEISQIYKINREEIEFYLIDKWLAANHISLDDKRDDLLEKAICILRQMPKDESVLYLLNRIIQEENGRNYVYKYRALKCLAAIADQAEIQSFSQNFITDVQGFLLAFYYLSQLEHLTLTLSSFLQCNKEKLALAMWSKLKHDSKVVNLISNFCLDYNITNVKLWEELLDEMIVQNMVTSIEKCISVKNSTAELWQSNSYIAAWQYILMSPFQNGTCGDYKEKITDYVQIAENLYRSPVCSHFFLEKLCAEFVTVGLPAVGVGCLYHISDADQRSKILTKYTSEEILQRIQDNLILFQNEAITFPQISSVLSFLITCSEKGFVQISSNFKDKPLRS